MAKDRTETVEQKRTQRSYALFLGNPIDIKVSWAVCCLVLLMESSLLLRAGKLADAILRSLKTLPGCRNKEYNSVALTKWPPSLPSATMECIAGHRSRVRGGYLGYIYTVFPFVKVKRQIITQEYIFKKGLFNKLEI